MKRWMQLSLGLATVAGLVGGAHAADHLDSPKATAEPAADITDVYAWMNGDATKLNLVLNVSPMAATGTQFSDAVLYQIHVNSMSAYGQAQQETKILCKFYDVSKLECWLGDEYVEGDASATTGLASSSGKLKVFAGLRNDPFFFELDGFKEAVKAVVAAAPSLTFDSNGCPSVNASTSGVLVNQLKSGKSGAPAKDFFAGTNVLSLVLQIDKTLVNKGGPVLAVWASTHAAS